MWYSASLNLKVRQGRFQVVYKQFIMAADIKKITCSSCAAVW